MDYGSEEALLRQAQASPEGVGAVYDAYADRIYGFCLKRVGHRETAEDLTSKVFMKFIEHVHRINWQGVSLGAWLFRVASNLMIDHWRAQKVRMDTPLDDDEEPIDLPSRDPLPDAFAELALEKDKLLVALKQLSPRDQEVLDLRFFAGLEALEIAEMLKISANHASVLIYRGQQRLRQKYIALYGNP
jgi:RNA polymerase sigma-70 factor (ECF subfamily)